MTLFKLSFKEDKPIYFTRFIDVMEYIFPAVSIAQVVKYEADFKSLNIIQFATIVDGVYAKIELDVVED